MAFIDKTYFFNDIELTGSQLSNVTQWINQYESEILTKLLGYRLKSELDADLDTNGNPQTAKFINLVNGGVEFNFDLNGYTIYSKWKGLRDQSNLKSLIAYYVYYQYRNYNETSTTTVGEKRNVGENSESANPEYKLMDAWNKMIDWYGYIPYDYFKYNCETLFLDNANYEHINKDSSAYNYLLANISDFENWVFEPIEKLNMFHL